MYNPGMSARNRSVWPWIAVLLFAVPGIYVLSFGPACWWSDDVVFNTGGPQGVRAPTAYWPLGLLALKSNYRPMYRLIRWYATLATPVVYVPSDSGANYLEILDRDEVINVPP
jgi:hypothetical protein